MKKLLWKLNQSCLPIQPMAELMNNRNGILYRFFRLMRAWAFSLRGRSLWAQLIQPAPFDPYSDTPQVPNDTFALNLET